MYSHVKTDNRGAHIKYFVKDGTFNVDEVFATYNNYRTLRGFHGSKNQRKIIKPLHGSFKLILLINEHNDGTFDKIVVLDNFSSTSEPILVELGSYIGYMALEDGSAMSYIVEGEYKPELELSLNPLSKIELWDTSEMKCTIDNINISEKDLASDCIEEKVFKACGVM